MKSSTLRSLRPILFCCLLLAFGAMSRADIIQCANEAGGITYTNGSCENIDDNIHGLTPNELPTSSTRDVRLQALETIAGKDAGLEKNSQDHRRQVSLDVETMRAARYSLQEMDRASALQRESRVALNASKRHWYYF